MNIRTDYLEALQRQQETGRKATETQNGEDGFAALFSREIGQNSRTGTAATQECAGRGALDAAMLVSPLGDSVNAFAARGLSILENLAGQASGLLDAWDQYAETLSGGGSQKAAWNRLLGMDDQVRALRGSLNALSESNPALEDIVNELEIMAATEKFKFNRGDYA